MSSSLCMIYLTAPSLAVAEELAKVLLEHRLASCVTFSPNASSLYCWQGQLEKSEEVLIWIKTLAPHREKVVHLINQLHPYDLPFVAFFTPQTLPEVVQWMQKELSSG